MGPWPLAPHHDHLQYIHHINGEKGEKGTKESKLSLGSWLAFWAANMTCTFLQNLNLQRMKKEETTLTASYEFSLKCLRKYGNFS